MKIARLNQKEKVKNQFLWWTSTQKLLKNFQIEHTLLATINIDDVLVTYHLLQQNTWEKCLGETNLDFQSHSLCSSWKGRRCGCPHWIHLLSITWKVETHSSLSGTLTLTHIDISVEPWKKTLLHLRVFCFLFLQNQYHMSDAAKF